VSDGSQSFQGSIVFNSAGSANVVVAGSSEPQDWTVTTTYWAANVNPDLRVILRIDDQTFLVAPGIITTTHKGKGSEVSLVCDFLAGVQLFVGWSASY